MSFFCETLFSFMLFFLTGKGVTTCPNACGVDGEQRFLFLFSVFRLLLAKEVLTKKKINFLFFLCYESKKADWKNRKKTSINELSISIPFQRSYATL